MSPRALLILVLCLGLGCAGPMGQLRRAIREPGEKLVALPDEVAIDYACETRHLPFVTIERNEINPQQLRPGAEFNHRLIYALCPVRATRVVEGTLRTRIRFKDRVIVQDQVEDFELKPGRWVVDAFVRLPEKAEPGVYALELEFVGPRVELAESLTFGVDGEPVRP